ncbi:tRNA (adenosine(37)-N6)-threonylcarbamoyltransferase complex dimerization subunit type 1 TsaB [Halioxenophilus aromaticivorans]|uniref:tRNA threonylcarbamoyladenosine biosynthesis protein TsaB n=1 Tax=Halioxenophilus aromaticivorans TaxID=1306992 RepID=A0AAV3TWA1_9ALTE
MAILLSLESSAEFCSASLTVYGDTQLKLHKQPRQHAQLLLPMVDELLQEASIGLPSVDAIAFSRGPGSFTGIRICMSVVQGLAFGQNTPVIPVSTLQALAVAAVNQGHAVQGQDVLAAFDARMDEVYIARYRVGPGLPELVGTEQVLPVGCIDDAWFDDNTVAVGSGWAVPELSGRSVAEVSGLAITAADIDAVAQQAFERGGTVAVEDATPVYLRNEITWKKRESIRRRDASV